MCLEPRSNCLTRLLRCHPRVCTRIDQYSRLYISRRLYIHARQSRARVRRLYDKAHRQAQRQRECHIRLIVRGYTHDCTRAVTLQHKIGDPDWYLLAGQRVQGVCPCEDARHDALFPCTQSISRLLVAGYRLAVCCVRDGSHQWMSGSQGDALTPTKSLNPSIRPPFWWWVWAPAHTCAGHSAHWDAAAAPLAEQD